ncbi:MAG: HAD family hydrolase, partial [Nitrososphaerales archaeon]
ERVSKAKKLLAEAEGASEASDGIARSLLNLAEKADSRGLISIEEALLKDDFGEALTGFTLLMSYPGRVGVSTIMTVFEEFFLGSDLFYKKYGIRPRFAKDYPGLVTREKPLVEEGTLTLLAEMVGESSLGIVSGRSSLTAEFTLRGILKRFNTELTVFVEDDIAIALKNGDGERVKEIGKPEPYALLRAEKSASRSGRILYVGDSREDVLMVERANSVTDRFIAAGVYGRTHSSRELMKMFIENGAYLITESVNDLPRLLMMVREKV